MAETKIERKKGLPVWALLLGLMLLLLLVWTVLAMRGNHRQEAPQDLALLAASAPPALVFPRELAETVPALARCA